MRLLHSKRLHNNICFFAGKANFFRINRLIQGSLTKHTGKQDEPAGKTDIGQSSGNKNSQADLLAHQILIFKSCPILTLCGGAYCTVVSLYLCKLFTGFPMFFPQNRVLVFNYGI